jgi:poly(3-hydroxybutyrate) depolymerase
MKSVRLFITVLLCAACHVASAAGRYFEVAYPPSKNTNELVFGVTYTAWIPEGVKTLRGVIVHQHGCGAGSARAAVTAAYDLHWQALAKKWDCVLIGPAYHMGEKDNCRLWCDPRNGSDQAFQKALGDIARQSDHPEIERVPWCLWGHSGGGFWSSLMLTLHPERVAAIWFRSGSAFGAWERGEIRKPDLTPAVFQVPVMFNGGVKETDPVHGPARVADRAMFKLWREHGAPAGFAPDPRTGHECGDSRYLAIPFLDSCLAMRLPPKGSKTQQLKPVNLKASWITPLTAGEAQPLKAFTGNPVEAGWMPKQLVPAWEEYTKTGLVGDATTPPPPTALKAIVKPEGVELAWDAEADFESGLQAFAIMRDGQEIGRWPTKPAGKDVRPLFQALSGGDTPVKPLPEMKFTDATAKPGERHVYAIVTINGVGLKSKPGKSVSVR